MDLKIQDKLENISTEAERNMERTNDEFVESTIAYILKDILFIFSHSILKIFNKN